MSSGALSAAQIVQLFEDGRDRHPLDRALVVLAAASPAARFEELAALPIGRRDAELLAVRERLFGRRLRFVSRCPGCAGNVEAEVDTRALRGAGQPLPAGVREVQIGERKVRYRLPDSNDLAAVLALEGDEASAALLRRCVLAVEGGSQALSPDVVAELDAAMATADPQAEIAFALSCPSCGRTWDELLDPIGFLWTELEAEAMRLLGEVHALASAYGWREAEILGLSAQRRRTYLEMVGV